MKVFLCTFLHFWIEMRIPAMISHLHWEFKCSSVKYAIMKAKQKLLFMLISPFSTTPASHINQSGKRTNVISTTLPSLALLYFQSHMIEQHRFVSDTDACFICESTGQLGYYIPVPDQLIWVKLFSLRIVYKNGHFFREFETILWQF